MQLLIGEIPERSTFNATETRSALVPWLTRCSLDQVLTIQWVSIQPGFSPMKLFARPAPGMRHKTGLRNISLSYSRISLPILRPSSALTRHRTPSTCAKAIRDGVIEATLNHAMAALSQYIRQRLFDNIAQEQFHQRIDFCLSVHNDAVRSMQYPPKGYKDKADEEREKKRRG